MPARKDRQHSSVGRPRWGEGLSHDSDLCRGRLNQALIRRQSRSGCSKSEQHATNDRNPNDLAA